MAELAVTDGSPPPADLPRGEFTCTRLDDGTIRVDHADPRIALNATLDTDGCAPPPWRATYAGAVLHIHGVNQHVIYRITEYVPRVHAYIAEWPD